MTEFRMPSLGADMVAGTLVEWLRGPGDRVRRGDIVAVVEALDLHVGFVGLDHRDQIASVHGITRLNEPLEEPALRHVGAE